MPNQNDPDLTAISPAISPETETAVGKPAAAGTAPVPAKVPSMARRIAMRTLLVIAILGIMAVSTLSGYLLRDPSIRHIAWTVITHPGDIFVRRGNQMGIIDPTGTFRVPNHFPLKPKTITVLVLGIDHDYPGKRLPNGDVVPIIDPNTPGRSDAIMIARFELDDDYQATSIKVLSIPRDSRVRLPGKWGVHKINAAHAYGGPELTQATIKQVFGIDTDYYLDINFEGFQQLVDSIGGVDLKVHKALDYDDKWGNLHVHLKPGLQHLDGYKAMGYVRIRHSDDDLARAQRQHEFLDAVKAQIISPSTFMKLPGIAGSITSNLKSNMTLDQMLTLANIARNAPKETVIVETLPVIEGKRFVYIDRRKSINLIHKLFFKDKQIADMKIQEPGEDYTSSRRRRRANRDRPTPTDRKPTEQSEQGDQSDSDTPPRSSGEHAAPDAVEPSTAPAPDQPAPPAEKRDKPASDSGTGTDPGNNSNKKTDGNSGKTSDAGHTVLSG